MSKIVDRTLDFIELFAEQRRPLSLSEISRLLAIPVSSCHDVIQALLARGYLYELGARGGFYPTLRLHKLSTTIASHDPVLQRADIALRALCEAIDESVSLAKADGMHLRYLAVYEPTQPLRFAVRVGDPVRALHATSAGKAFLGSLPPDALRRALEAIDFRPFTARTIVDRGELEADLRRGARRGWFLNQEESVEGATTLSAHFPWSGATYVVTVAAPTARIRPRLEDVAARVRATCAALADTARG